MKKKLYEVVYDDLKEKISKNVYKIGDKIPNAKSLAKKYGVSEITINHALTDLKKQGYVSRKPKEGTIVLDIKKGSLPKKETSTLYVGVIISKFDSVFGIDILNGLLDNSPKNVELIVKKTNGNTKVENEVISELVDIGVHGLIILPTSSEYIAPSLLNLISKNFPIVLIDRFFSGVPVSTVLTDNAESAWKAIDYLFSNGHKKIAFITSASKISAIDDRERGYISAHATNNIPLNPDYIQHLITSDIDYNKLQTAKDIKKIKAFIQDHNEITAFFSTEFYTATLILKACTEIGLSIPDDVSLICYDYPKFDSFFSPINFTHIEQDQYQFGKTSIELIIEIIKNNNFNIHSEVVPDYLVIGNSVKDISTVPNFSS